MHVLLFKRNKHRSYKKFLILDIHFKFELKENKRLNLSCYNYIFKKKI